jgi:hypothetical protein
MTLPPFLRSILVATALLSATCPLMAALRDEPKCDWAAFDRDAAAMRSPREAAMKVTITRENETEVPQETIDER